MEQLYPLNIIERRYPIIREQREKAERDAAESTELTKNDDQSVVESEDVSLYEPIPYTQGSVGKHLNTLA